MSKRLTVNSTRRLGEVGLAPICTRCHQHLSLATFDVTFSVAPCMSNSTHIRRATFAVALLKSTCSKTAKLKTSTLNLSRLNFSGNLNSNYCNLFRNVGLYSTSMSLTWCHLTLSSNLLSCHAHCCITAPGRRARPTSLALTRQLLHRLLRRCPLQSFARFLELRRQSTFLYSFSSRSGSLNLRCSNCAFVSHVSSGLLRSLPGKPSVGEVVNEPIDQTTARIWICSVSANKNTMEVWKSEWKVDMMKNRCTRPDVFFKDGWLNGYLHSENNFNSSA